MPEYPCRLKPPEEQPRGFLEKLAKRPFLQIDILVLVSTREACFSFFLPSKTAKKGWMTCFKGARENIHTHTLRNFNSSSREPKHRLRAGAVRRRPFPLLLVITCSRNGAHIQVSSTMALAPTEPARDRGSKQERRLPLPWLAQRMHQGRSFTLAHRSALPSPLGSSGPFKKKRCAAHKPKPCASSISVLHYT